MSKILFLHGFASAGSTGTATALRAHYYPLGTSVIAPDIPVQPEEAVPFLEALVASEKPDIIVGTSMGAMYAELLRGYTRVLVNPSFQMSRHLTFNHLGKNVDFRNPREDGAKSFKVDRPLVQQFQALEKTRILKGITPAEKQLVWGLFGTRDNRVNCQKEFQKAYGRDHFQLFDGEHFLDGNVLKHAVLPLLNQLLGL